MAPVEPPKIASNQPDADATCVDRHEANAERIADLRRRLLGSTAAQSVAEVFKLLGDPSRVRVLDVLAQGEQCVCDLAAIVGLTESAVSHQLRLLRAARLVRVRRTGRMAFYSLDDHHVIGLLHDARKHVEEGLHER